MSEPQLGPSPPAIRDFRLLTQARFLYAFAAQIQALVMGWQVYAIKHDPLYLGLIGLTEAAPALTLALISGHIVDRGDPLRIYRAILILSLLSAGMLVGVSSSSMAPDAQVGWIYCAAFMTGVARGFAQPSMYSLIPQLVPRSYLSVSSAWITTAFQMAAVVGPSVGGVLFAWKGAVSAYLVNLVMLVFALIAALAIRFKPQVNPHRHTAPVLASVGEGLRFVFGHQILLSALALDMFAVLFGGVTAILPVFAGEVLKVGPTGLGILRAAPAAGALVGSAVLIRKPVMRAAGRILLAVVAGFGLCMIGFALSTVFWISVALLALSGALDSVSMVIRGAIVQLSSPDEMRGRVAAVNSIFIGSSNEIGAFESGVAAKLLGTVPSVIAGGCLTLLTVALAAWRAPKLREMDLSKL